MKKIIGRWLDHFEELLNRPAPSYPPDIPMAAEVNCAIPYTELLRKAIFLLKTGTTPGPEEMSAEAIKSDMETSLEMLYVLIGKICDSEEIPKGWEKDTLSRFQRNETYKKARSSVEIMLLKCLKKSSIESYWKYWK